MIDGVGIGSVIKSALRDRYWLSIVADIASKRTGMSSKNLSIAQSFELHVLSASLLRQSGTICLPAFAELWKNCMLRLFIDDNKD